MNEEAKHAMDSLIKARIYLWEECAKAKCDSDENVDAIWEGYLTLISALYMPQPYQLTVGMNPEGQ